MAEAEQPYLRLYCVCGQKMKVTGSLFGRPGKCVACRQKIRIPRFEEIPAGVTEIHLKDHPEYLRGGSRAPRKLEAVAAAQSRDVVLRHREEAESDDTDTPDEEEHVELTDSHVVSTVALDVLEPLRNLFSLGNKLQRQLETLEKSDTIYAEVKGRLARIKKVRVDLEEQLRQMLMEVAIELAMTHDKIAQTQLSARIGEISYDDFKGDIYRQRSRRDSLERRQQNLRGWIATTDVRSAGGFVDVPPDSIPDDGFRVTVPAEPRTTAPLVDVHTSALREAFEARSKAERTLAELERMKEGSQTDWNQARANAKSARTFADANIEFRQDRLKQLRGDYEEDLETISAQLDMVRSRMQSGQLDRAAYDKEEKKLARGQADLRKALSIIDRALSANSAPDVPQAKGTFLGRMAADEQGDAEVLPIENGLTWAGAGLLAFAIFLPLVGNLSPFGAFLEFDGPGSYSFLVMLLFAGVVGGAVFIRDVRVRVLVLSAAWILGLFVAAWIMREALYSTGATSARFRTVPPLLVRPGFLAVVAAAVCVAGAIGFGLRRAGWPIAAVGGVIAAGLVLVIVALTDFGGINRPEPAVAVQLQEMADGRGQFARIAVSNAGGRSMYLLPSASDARAAYQLFVERRIGENSWGEVPPSAFASNDSRGTEEISPGETIVKTASLNGGDYRVLLVSKALGYRSEEIFSVTAAEPAPEPAPESSAVAAPEPAPQEVVPAAEEPEEELTLIFPDPAPAAIEEIEDSEPLEPPAPRLEVAFQGAGARGEGQYRLSFIVYLPAAPTQRVFVSLGEEIIDGWIASAYDPGGNRVTLVRGAERRNLVPGEIAALEE